MARGAIDLKAVVTGCAGFIGSNLTDFLLQQGHQVIGIDCFTDYYSKEVKQNNLINAINNEKFQLLETDILNIDDFPSADYVFHLAAQAGVRASWGSNFEVYTRCNIDATQKLLEFYKFSTIKKFIFASSSSVYGDAELPMNEEVTPRPISPYGVTKLAAENLCYLYAKNYKIPIVSLRYFTVYGPRQRPDMAIHRFTNAALDGEKITVFGDGTQTRDFTHVSDIIRGMWLAAQSEFAWEIFNLGGGSTISINALISILASITKQIIKTRYVEKQKGDVRDTLANIKRAEHMLGWKPVVGIREGLQQYVDWRIEVAEQQITKIK